MAEVVESELELPRYDCHKKVSAALIGGIDRGVTPAQSEPIAKATTLALYDPLDAELIGYVTVSAKWMNARESVEVGGYYVVYEDGYSSYSPKEAFEDGYTRD